ncbi:hypothetical protein BDB01DRAFT_839788 [Pilobolus umbonatus]|nr:hypothetical protein BDB01DRAFT_839788 [Pilobolus umbonatus]
MSTKATYNIFYCFTRTTISKTNHFTIQIRPEQDQNKIQRSKNNCTSGLDINVGSAEASAPKKEWKQPIEVEYNLPTRYNPNKRRFRPNTEKAKARQKQKDKLNLLQSIIDYFMKKED